ncbi:MAG TPA: SGNH/GDSL hydrolase family protein [Polyangiaceae bacterium]|nr:SGNH/GDSL hydrolase family protein [Polyangiaceae bacterium]
MNARCRASGSAHRFLETLNLTPVLLGLSLLGACSTDPQGTGGSGGASSNQAGGSGSSGTAGKAGTAGMSASGGRSATAGAGASGGASGTPNGGGAGTAGMSASGGSSALGGMNASGGVSGNGGISGSGGGSGSGGIDAGASGGPSGGTGGGATKWVASFTASPYLAASDAQPPSSLSSAVLRQIVHLSLGGSQMRFQFSNLSGNGDVIIDSVHVALCKATPAVDSTIDTTTDKALSFSGMPKITIAAGKEVWSDTLDFPAPALANLTITMALGSVPSNLTAHAGSRTTSYVQAGSTDVSQASMTSAQGTDHWYFISGVDVMADTSAVAAVAIGDSITDGRGSDTNHFNRWTDILAARLQADPTTKHVALVNQGIGGTNLAGTGTAAEARFARDVLGQSGVKYVIILDGVNDINGNASAQTLQSVYDKLIKQAHDEGLLVYGGTITPFNGHSYYTVAHEQVRTTLNTYIRGGAFDGVIDFDEAISDGKSPPSIQAKFAEWAQQDGLHPGPAGYEAMGDAADLALFKQ